MDGIDSDAVLSRFGPLGTDNYRNQRGNSIDLGRGTKYGIKQTVVYTGATSPDDERPIGNALAAACTLTTTYLALATPSGSPPRVEGLIKWGNDGHQAECRFDWKKGVAIQVNGAEFELSAELLPPAHGAEIGEEDRVRVGAFIGYYPTQHCRATLTRYVTVPGGAVSAPLPVPPCACDVLIYPDNGGTWEARYETQAGVVLAALDDGPFEDFARAPVPNGADQIVIEDTGGAAGMYAVVWGLTL